MKESLAKLLELQTIDSGIDSLKRSQVEFPSEISRLKAKLKTAHDKVDGKRTTIKDLDSHRRRLEGDLEAITEDLKKHQERLYEVKSNREYDALQHEIEALKTRLDENETGVLESIEQADGLKAQLKEEDALYKELEQENLERIKDLEAQLGSVDENVREHEEKRAVIESQIERRALSAYARIRKVLKGGVAVVKVEKNSCGGCFRQLAPQRRVEVRRQDQVIRCEICGRIVVWQDET
jgi:predicted  nucleic acid-binding Zn-ribbon protein